MNEISNRAGTLIIFFIFLSNNVYSYGGKITEGIDLIAYEIVADAPWRIEPEAEYIPVNLILHNWRGNDKYNFTEIHVYDENNGGGEVNLYDENFQFIGSTLGGELPTIIEDDYQWGRVIYVRKNELNPIENNYSFSVKFAGSKTYTIDDGGIQVPVWVDYPVVNNFTVKDSSTTFPKINQDWFCGDAHFHTFYSDNFVEFGAPVEASAEAAKTIGLDWFAVTDHSFDLDSDEGKIDIKDALRGNTHDEKVKWAEYKADCAAVDSDVKCLLGEEVSVVNSRGRYVHLLGYNLENLDWAVPGEGGGGMWTIDLSPLNQNLGSIGIFPNIDYTYETNYDSDGDGVEDTAATLAIQDAITQIDAVGGFSYFAHPVEHLLGDTELFGRDVGDYVNYGVLHRDGYQQLDYDLTGYTGLQIWNGNSERSKAKRDEGVNIWRGQMLKHLGSDRRIYVEGGSDAHGDFNYYRGAAGNEMDNAFGRVRTCCQASSLTKDNLYSALRNGNCFISDGPALDFSVVGDSVAGLGESTTVDSGDAATVSIRWNSTSEFGAVSQVRLCKGRLGREDEDCYLVNGAGWHDVVVLDDPLAYPFLVIDEDSYFRVEAATSTGHRAYTNPIWVDMNPVVNLRITAMSVVSEGYGTYSGEGGALDGNVNGGEYVTLRLAVENVGALDGEDVQVRLEGIQDDCVHDYGPFYTNGVFVGAGETEDVGDVSLDVVNGFYDPSCTDGHVIEADVVLRDEESGALDEQTVPIRIEGDEDIYVDYDFDFRNPQIDGNPVSNDSRYHVAVDVSTAYDEAVDATVYYQCGDGLIDADHYASSKAMFNFPGTQSYEWRGTINLVDLGEDCEGEELYWRVKALDEDGNWFWSPLEPYRGGVIADDDTAPPSFTFHSSQGMLFPQEDFTFNVSISDVEGVLDDNYYPTVYYRFDSQDINADAYDGLLDLDWDGTAYSGTLALAERYEGQQLYWRVYAGDKDNSPAYGWSPVLPGPTVYNLVPPEPALDDNVTVYAEDGDTYGIILDWNDVVDGSGIYQYEVEQDGVTVNATHLSIINLSGIDEGIHDYRVRAQDNAGNWGDWSDSTPIYVSTTPHLPDLALYPAGISYSISPFYPYPFTLYVTAENEGALDATDVSLEIRARDYYMVEYLLYKTTISSVPSKGQVTVGYSSTLASLPANLNHVEISVDPENAIPEIREDNNQLSWGGGGNVITVLATDADGDGVSDAVDACPGTPTGESVDADGCSLAQRADADGDGIIDTQDACPRTPGSYCNGCPAPNCTGCAAASCPAELPPTCQDAGTCPAHTCSEDDHCGWPCAADEYADYPDTEPGVCLINGNEGTCGPTSCTPDCAPSDTCTVWAGDYNCTGDLPPADGDWTIDTDTSCWESLLPLANANLRIQNQNTLNLQETYLKINTSLSIDGALSLSDAIIQLENSP